MEKDISERQEGLKLFVVQSLSHVWLCNPWTEVCQASLFFAISQSLLKHMSVDSGMLSNHLILCHPLLLLLPIFPSIGIFSNESSSHQGPKHIGVLALASVLPMNIQDWFPSGLTALLSLQSEGLSKVFSNTTVQKHQFFSTQLSLWSNSHIHTWLLEKP